MRTIVAFAASVAVNALLLSALDWSVAQAQRPPNGEVSITQLPFGSEWTALASASSDEPRNDRG